MYWHTCLSVCYYGCMCVCSWWVSGARKLFSHFTVITVIKDLQWGLLRACLYSESSSHSSQPVGCRFRAVMDICGFVATLQTMCALFRQPGVPLFLSPSSGLIKFAPIYSYALISISAFAVCFCSEFEVRWICSISFFFFRTAVPFNLHTSLVILLWAHVEFFVTSQKVWEEKLSFTCVYTVRHVFVYF